MHRCEYRFLVVAQVRSSGYIKAVREERMGEGVEIWEGFLCRSYWRRVLGLRVAFVDRAAVCGARSAGCSVRGKQGLC